MALAGLAFLMGFGCQTTRPAEPPFVGASVEFELVQDSLIVVPGRINGHEAGLIFDTGCDVMVLSEEFASELGLANGTEGKVFGVAGVETRKHSNLTVEVGGVSFEGLKAHVVDLSTMTEMAGRPLQALIGGQLMQRVVVELDFVRNRLLLREPEDCLHSEWEQSVQLRGVEGGWVVDGVFLEGRGPESIQVDTGNAAPLWVFTNAFTSWTDLLDDGRYSEPVSFTGIGGQGTGVVALIEDLEIGTGYSRSGPAVFAGVPQFTCNWPVAGILGNRAFGRCRIVLDGPHGRFGLFDSSED